MRNFYKLIFIFCILIFMGISFCLPKAQAVVDFQPMYLQIQEITGAAGMADLVKRIYNYALGIIAVFALGAIVYGSVLWIISAGSPGKLEDAKSWILGAIIGIVLMFGAVVLFREINPNLPKLVEPELPPVTTPTPDYSSGGSDLSGLPPLVGSDWPLENLTGVEDFAARINLLNNTYEVTVNRGNCVIIGQSKCTSLDGMPQSAIDNVKALANEAQQSLIITGGTEYWLHSENTKHRPGNSVVDLAFNPAIVNNLDTWKASGKVKFYQCERQGIPVPCGGGLTPDHFHVEFN